ncbi:hypothetical protein [Bacillus sp. SG-1]|uniref:hypothetical protein n=1 Tax=Bacillus sp. SG-1 TaxID=161544 RepID=UPI00015436AA|nr:hypothetical protein [Bacillus sp. SG-1]EDL65550.1 hypothetical protein BSG1_00590 [Bacillus sp. SG-1]
MTVIYDHQFNVNEWFILIVLALSFVSLFFLKPRMELPLLLTIYLFGVTSGMFFDHTISLNPFNFYDVNDTSNYQLIDFISYVMYGPFAYFFVYFYEKFKITGMKNILYVIIWTVVAICVEWVAHKAGIFHYRNGYKLFYSIPIYLFNQTILIGFSNLILSEFKQKQKIKQVIKT